MDEGESPREPCVREIEEELGLRLEASQEPLMTAWIAGADDPPLGGQ
ncbi:hypothetical protein [Streptomyces albus]|nr:hypothetical protein [Streptomyces albus]